jgi:beta-lactamase family protein
LTALTVVSLIEQGQLQRTTTARSVLAEDLPLIGDEVTVEQLLAHRSGIGDYLDEEADHALTDYVLPVPVHELASTEQYLRVLGGYPAKFAPDERFSYWGPTACAPNVFHLPVRGSGDGGIYATVADIHAMWAALFAGQIVAPDWVTKMVRPTAR